MTRVQLKQSAKEKIKGKIWPLALCILVAGVVEGIFSYLMNTANENAAAASPWLIVSFIAVAAVVILTALFSVAWARIYLGVANGVTPRVTDILNGTDILGKAVWLEILMGIFTVLWSLLLVVPGFIKLISYSMSFYILAENPGMTAREALTESKRITEGHKMDLFILGLSFIPWFLLIPITFGLAAFYVTPYVNVTMVHFYQTIKRKN